MYENSVAVSYNLFPLQLFNDNFKKSFLFWILSDLQGAYSGGDGGYSGQTVPYVSLEDFAEEVYKLLLLINVLFKQKWDLLHLCSLPA